VLTLDVPEIKWLVVGRGDLDLFGFGLDLLIRIGVRERDLETFKRLAKAFAFLILVFVSIM